MTHRVSPVVLILYMFVFIVALYLVISTCCYKSFWSSLWINLTCIHLIANLGLFLQTQRMGPLSFSCLRFRAGWGRDSMVCAKQRWSLSGWRMLQKKFNSIQIGTEWERIIWMYLSCTVLPYVLNSGQQQHGISSWIVSSQIYNTLRTSELLALRGGHTFCWRHSTLYRLRGIALANLCRRRRRQSHSAVFNVDDICVHQAHPTFR